MNKEVNVVIHCKIGSYHFPILKDDDNRKHYALSSVLDAIRYAVDQDWMVIVFEGRVTK